MTIGTIVLGLAYIFFLAWLFDNQGWNDEFREFFDKLEWYILAVYSIVLAIFIVILTTFVFAIINFVLTLIYKVCTTKRNR